MTAGTFWKVEQNEDGTCYIVSLPDEGKLYAKINGHWGHGIGITAEASSKQKWKLEAKGDAFLLVNAASGRKLYAQDGHDLRDGFGATVGGPDWPDQMWTLQGTESGTVISNVHSQRLLFASAEHVGAARSASPEVPREGYPKAKPRLPSPEVLPEEALSSEEVEEFKRNGYLVLRKAIPLELWHKALRAINNRIGQPNHRHEHKRELVKAPDDFKLNRLLMQAPRVWAAIHSLINSNMAGPLNVEACEGAVTLSYPEAIDATPQMERGWHIDGMDRGPGIFSSFSLLVGVALSDQSMPGCGNLLVYPESHMRNDIQDWLLRWAAGDASGRPDLGGAPVPVLLEPGDVVVAHRFLAHSGSKNYSPNIRYQVYFRLRPEEWLDENEEYLKPWSEFV